MTAVIASDIPSVDEVVGRIKDNVWTLLLAGQMDAALVLMRSQLEDFQRAWRLENLGVAEAPAPVMVVHAEVITSEPPHSGVITETGSLAVVHAVGSATVKKAITDGRRPKRLAKTG